MRTLIFTLLAVLLGLTAFAALANGVPALLRGSGEPEALRLAELATLDKKAPVHVSVDGALVQCGAPDSHRHDGSLYYVLVSSGTPITAGAPFRPGADDPMVIVRSRGREVPLEAFVAPAGGPEALPRVLSRFRAQGMRRVGALPEAARRAALGGMEVAPEGTVVVALGAAPLDRLGGALLCAVGVGLFWLARGAWRRRRRPGVGAGVRPQAAARPAPDRTSPARKGRGVRVPVGLLAKVGGVLLVGALALAKLGGRVADDLAPVARSASKVGGDVARLADEVGEGAAAGTTTARRAPVPDLTAPSAGERATDAAKEAAGLAIGQATNIKSLVDALDQLGPPSDRGSGELRVERLEERYTRVRQSQGEPLPLPTYSLADDDSKIVFAVGVRSERLSAELPDRDLGEYTWVRFEPLRDGGAIRQRACTVRFETGIQSEHGWIEPLAMQCEFRFVTGSWDELRFGTPCALVLTEDGARDYARGWDEVLERAIARQSDSEGLRHVAVSSRTANVPRIALAVDDEGLEVTAPEPFASRVDVRIWR